MSLLDLRFVPQINGTIRCERYRADGSRTSDVVYNRTGIKPNLNTLTAKQQIDWQEACDVAGW